MGDKRSGIVYDLDAIAIGEQGEGFSGAGSEAAIDEIIASEQYVCFAPDTLAEARNRGYRPYRRRSALGCRLCSAFRAAIGLSRARV